MSEQQKEKKTIWEDNGYISFLGIKLPFVKYVLKEDSITATTGLFLRHTETIPLYRIAAKQVDTNFFGRLVDCGTIRLITRGREVPDMELSVKHPNKIAELIDETEKAERRRYQFNSQRKKQNSKNKR